MTIKDLYEWAVESGLENADLIFRNSSMLRDYPITTIYATEDGREVYIS